MVARIEENKQVAVPTHGEAQPGKGDDNGGVPEDSSLAPLRDEKRAGWVPLSLSLRTAKKASLHSLRRPTEIPAPCLS
jgi:hypothetical protein